MTSSILMVALLSIPTFLSFSALIRMSGMQEAAASSSGRLLCVDRYRFLTLLRFRRLRQRDRQNAAF